MNGKIIRIKKNILILYSLNLSKINVKLNQKIFKFPILTFWFQKVLTLIIIKVIMKINIIVIRIIVRINKLIILLKINH
jgi:hypothetical protein